MTDEERRVTAERVCRLYNTGHDRDPAWMRENHVNAMEDALEKIGYFALIESARKGTKGKEEVQP